MALFKYRAVDLDGKTVEGTIEEPSAARVTGVLRERGLCVSTVEKIEKSAGFLRHVSRLTWDDLDLLTRELQAVTERGLPLASSLKAVADDTGNRRLKPILDDIRSQVESGSSLGEAITSRSKSYPAVYTSAIRAGERAGNLSGVLRLLSAHCARMVEVRKTIQHAFAYPIVVLVIASVVMWFLLIKIVPVFAEIFEDFGMSLPCATRFWLGVSLFVSARLVTLIPWLAIALIAVHFISKRLARSYVIDWIGVHIPVFGALYSTTSMGRFSRSLGLLLASKVPVVESLDLASAAARNAVLQRAVMDAALRVEEGKSVSDALASTGYFSRGFCSMAHAGEERGEADIVLLSLADIHDTGVGQSGRPAAVAAGDALIACVIAIVGFFVVSMCLPMLRFAGLIGIGGG